MDRNSPFPDPREHDIMAGDRRVSRPDASLPDWHIPDAAYRPIPIAWFAAAFLIQMIVLLGLFVTLIKQPAWLTISLATFVTVVLARWTWDRGMKRAGAGWQIATAAALAIQLAFVWLGALVRI